AEMCEPSAFAGHPIEVRRAVQRGAERLNVAVAEVVAVDADEVGRGGLQQVRDAAEGDECGGEPNVHDVLSIVAIVAITLRVMRRGSPADERFAACSMH